MGWQSVESFVPHALPEGAKAVLVGDDDSIYLVMGSGNQDEPFGMRKLLDRTPDFGLKSYLAQGDSIGWPTDGLTPWKMLGYTPACQKPIRVDSLFIPLINDGKEPSTSFVIREIYLRDL